MQQFLKPTAGSARAWIIATELFEQFFVSMNHSAPALDLGFGREALLTLACDLETRIDWGSVAWFS
jgi:hypothetical protein